MILAAIASHVVGTIASYAFGNASRGRVFDVGHAIVSARPHMRKWVELVTCVIPLLCRKSSPNKSLATFSIVTFLRGLCIATTVLPALVPVGAPSVLMLVVGHGYDYVFSGHAAFAASWILNSPGYVEWTLGTAQAFGLIATRMHYTVDVLLAWIIVWLINSFHPRPKFALRYVALPDLDAVARLRHQVYVDELKHHEPRPDNRLPESTDANKVLIGAFRDDSLVGYVGITMPSPGGMYSLESYGFSKPAKDSYEIRALCVSKKFRRAGLGKSLLRAAIKFARSSSKNAEIVAMAREQLVDAYVSHGMRNMGEIACVNGTWYYLVRGRPVVPAKVPGIAWELPFSETDEVPCFHGGASLADVRKTNNISADVLDAWYDPCPAAVRAATQDAAWAMRTSPPTNCEPLIEAIADARGVLTDNIAVGAGSSELIFRCFSTWLTKSSRALLVEPTYGEYSHVLRNVIGCAVDSVHLSESDGFCLDVGVLKAKCRAKRYDLVVIVNPNSPFGTHHPDLASVVPRLGTRVWIDETYVDYVGKSLEPIAAASPHVIVCKTMSKIYALSGCRVGYVCGHPTVIRGIRARTPPWIVSRPTQAAAIAAVRDAGYYAAKIKETHAMRETMERKLSDIPGVRVLPGCANWTLIKLPAPVADVVARCMQRGVYLRDTHIPGYCRIAVTRETDAIVNAVRDALHYNAVQ
jgi:histidinol-phosphate/aromatic aminotransferase/cobyric acid decarboxylase-like protein/ribosomal protein S18 acetylase RimI-like enzyme